MKRRKFLQTTALASVVAVTKPAFILSSTLPSAASKEFELDELTISELQEGLKSGKFSARSLVRKYLDRIDDVDKGGPSINSVIEINPDAASIAESLDRERKEKGPRGPLHGIPRKSVV